METIANALTVFEIVKILAGLIAAIIIGFIWIMRVKWTLDILIKRFERMEVKIARHIEESEKEKQRIIQVSERVHMILNSVHQKQAPDFLKD